MSDSRATTRDSYARWLALAAFTYALTHHIGSLPNGMGEAPGQTRWADWLDLFTPYAVLLPAAAALLVAKASRRVCIAFGLGALMYAQGHGIHLSANSIGNVAPGDVVHLWDEVWGHYVWYAGVSLAGAAVAVTMRGRPRPGLLAYALAIAVGVTWGTNGVGGGTQVASLIVAMAAVGWGLRHRGELPVTLAVGFAPAAVLLLGDLAL